MVIAALPSAVSPSPSDTFSTTCNVPSWQTYQDMCDNAGHQGAAAPSRLPQLRLHYHNDQKRDGENSESDDQSSFKPKAVERKRPRYLSDIDRSVIIQRLEKGEKQADLAREFGVTRAAICHINKNKKEVLTRFDEFARSPHGRVLIENYSRPSTEYECVTEVRTAAASVLTTRLKDRTTSAATFCASANRLIKLLLEEALVSFGSASVATDALSSQGVELLTEETPCAVALDRDGWIMLDNFKEMEPEAPTGSIKGTESFSESHQSSWQVMCVDLPEGISAPTVLLLVPEYTSALFASAAIEELRGRGVPASAICIVCVSCSLDAVRDTAHQHPDVSIITAHVDKRSQGTAESLDGFATRYVASTSSVDA